MNKGKGNMRNYLHIVRIIDEDFNETYPVVAKNIKDAEELALKDYASDSGMEIHESDAVAELEYVASMAFDKNEKEYHIICKEIKESEV